MAKKNYRTPTAPEPEELSPTNVDGADPARAAITKERKRKAKHQPFIDLAVNWMKGEPTTNVEVDIVLREAYSMTAIDAAARLGFLKQVKLDGRLTIIGGGADCRLALADEQPEDSTPQVDIESENKMAEKAVEDKTLADHLADAQGRPTQLQFPHTIGTWVNYAKEGMTWTPAQIFNMTTSGIITLYDLKTEGGKKVKEVPAFQIEQLAPEVERNIRDHERLVQFEKHNKAGQEIAQMLAAEQAVEVEQAEALKGTRKRIDVLQEKLNKHPYNLVSGDQMQIDMEHDDGAATVSSPVIPDTSTAQERLIGRITSNDTLELTGDNQPWDKLHLATLKAEASTGKPQKIVPLTIDQAPGQWVCVGYQESVAILLKALPKAEWNEKYEMKFGATRDLPNQAQDVFQAAGGPLCGCPVKVGRATLYLAPLDEALLLKLPVAAAAQS